jgi:hypothetical protein
VTAPHGAPGRLSARARIALGRAIGVVSGLLGLLPHLLSGARLPAQDLWLGPESPDRMPFALLPLSQIHVVAIVSVLVVPGLLAGLAGRTIERRMPVPRTRPHPYLSPDDEPRQFPTWPVSTGLALVAALAIIQSGLTLGEGIGASAAQSDPRAPLYVTGAVVGAVGAGLLGQVVLWFSASRQRSFSALGVSLAAVPVAGWLTLLLSTLGTESPTILSAVMHWAPVPVVAVALCWCGWRPVARLWVWAASLLALWVVPAILSTAQVVLGSPSLLSDPEGLVRTSVEIFRTVAADHVVAVLVAAGAAVAGRLAIELAARGAGAHEADPGDLPG